MHPSVVDQAWELPSRSAEAPTSLGWSVVFHLFLMASALELGVMVTLVMR